MANKLINVGTEDYTLWIPSSVRVAVMGMKTPAYDDEGNLIELKSRITFHDGSGRSYDSPLPAHQIVKLIEKSNSDFEE